MIGGGRPRRRRPRWRTPLALVAAAVLAAAPAVLPTRAAADDRPVVESSFEVPGTREADGRPVQLDVSVLTTTPGVPRPAIVLAHGFGGTKSDTAPVARGLARDGYTVITYTARGFGRSGGFIHLGDPRFEGADTVRLIDFAAELPEVARAGDDPVLGFAGASYGGAAALLAAGLDRRVDAIVPSYTWHSLTQALVPQYLSAGPQSSAAAVRPNGTGTLKERWAALFFGAGRGARSADQDADLCGRFAPQICRAYLRAAEQGVPDRDLIAALDRADLGQVVPRISAPTLILHGIDDTLFPLDQADATFAELPADTPKAMAWVVGGHDIGIDLDAQLPKLRAWFDRYLAQQPVPAPPTFSVEVPQTRLVGQTAGSRPPQLLTADRYPVGDRVVPTTVALTGEPQALVNPPGGVPTALTGLPGSGAALGAATAVGGYRLAVLPGQSATFTSAPLTSPRTLVGSARIELAVTSSSREATLFASVWDLGPDGSGSQAGVPQTAVLPQRAVAPVRLIGLTPDRPSTVSIVLPPVVHEVPIGHRLQVVVSSTDLAYAGPTAATEYRVALANGAKLSLLPIPLAAEPTPLQVPWWLAVVVGLLGAAAVAAVLLAGVRARRDPVRDDLRVVPLAVDGLVKAYRNGVLAVDGVSFRAERGQVVGLLGPNGAGKTTTMRMLVGLIRPDAGSVYVHGRPVHAGAEVLGDVGALIEGPGFLPHLSGRANLHAYWAATGRPATEARFDEALAIAGLGAAVDRPVRGYSQGMRQRLGIAQAMLGLPSLLLLDEPTNGLDPPQIRAMRQVLADYAAAGRTVVVSSHLLAEVERTCSHVVVMHRGTVVLTGAVAELTRAGSLDARRLEDVFMGLVGADAVAGPGAVDARA